MSKITTPKQDRVPFWEKLSLGTGSLASFFGFGAIGIMALPVYNILLGVDAKLVGIALMIPRIWDALTDPLMGRISDNHHSRRGRRRPFVVTGALIMGTLFTFVWTVPADFSEIMKMVYFVIMQILFFTAYTVFSVPYNALTYEMTPDYNERTRVMAFVAFFHKCGEALCGWMLPIATALGVVIIGAKAMKDGEKILTMPGVLIMSALFGIFIMMLCGMLPGLTVKERFQRKTGQQDKVKISEAFKGALSSPAFLILVTIIFLNTLAGVLAANIDQYLLIYFMNNGDIAAGLVQKAMLSTGYAVVGFAAIPIITWLATHFGKKGSLYFVYTLMVVGSVAKWWIFTPGHTIYTLGKISLDPVMMIDPLMCGPMWVAVKIMLSSMMADICDEDELKHGQRREGMYGAVFSWMEKLVVSIAASSAGFALAFAGFNPDLGGAQAAETFLKIRIFLAGAPALAAILAIIALFFYPITAKRAAETRRVLEERRGGNS